MTLLKSKKDPITYKPIHKDRAIIINNKLYDANSLSETIIHYYNKNELATIPPNKDDFTEELKLSTESSTKASVNSKISDITNRISTKTTNIALLSKEVTDSEKELQTKMFNVEKEMQDYIKKISSKV